jgi:hypothetical protein
MGIKTINLHRKLSKTITHSTCHFIQNWVINKIGIWKTFWSVLLQALCAPRRWFSEAVRAVARPFPRPSVDTRILAQKVLSPLGLSASMPTQNDQIFAEWWRKSCRQTPKEKKKGFNSIMILGAWVLWKHKKFLHLSISIVIHEQYYEGISWWTPPLGPSKCSRTPVLVVRV